MKRSQFVIAAGMCAVVGGCDDVPQYVSAQDQLGVSVTSLAGQILDAPEAKVHAIVGSQVCVELEGWLEEESEGVQYHVRSGEDADDWLSDCFDPRAAGGAHMDAEGCLVLDDVGETALELAPTSCEIVERGDATFVADRLPVRAYGLDELELHYHDAVVRTIWVELDPGPVESFGRRPAHVFGEEFLVLAGEPFLIFEQPFARGDGGHAVAHSEGVAVAIGDDPPTPSTDPNLLPTLTVEPGQRFAMALDVAGGRLVGDDIVGVDAAAAATIQIVVGYDPCDDCDDDYGAPGQALAVVRDAAGTRLHGAHVEWSVDGDAPPVTADAIFPDAAEFQSNCDDDDAGEDRYGELRASYRGLEASVGIAFVCPVRDEDDGVDDDDDDWDVDVVDDDAPGDDEGFFDLGCGCSTGDSDSPTGLLALVPVLLARPRRRIIVA